MHTDSESLSDTGKIPDLNILSEEVLLSWIGTYWLDGKLGHCQLTGIV